MTTDLDQIKMSSSAANEALHAAVCFKDWKNVKSIIRRDMENVLPDEREEVLRLLQERRLATRMTMRPVKPEEVVPTISREDKKGLLYFVRCGEAVGTGHFYKHSSGIEFGGGLVRGDFVAIENIDEIFEITLLTGKDA